MKSLKDIFKFKKNDIDAEPEDLSDPSIKNYFKLLLRKFSKLLSLNLMMVVQLIPLALIAFIFFTGSKAPSPVNMGYPLAFGAYTAAPTASASLLMSELGLQLQLPFVSIPEMVGIIALGVVFALTFGWTNVGASYVLREMSTGNPTFVWSDFFYAIKKNLRQGFLMGLIDSVVFFVLAFDIYFYYTSTASLLEDFKYFVILSVGIIYIVMRFYMYLMLVTFDLSIFKIFKNALIFTVLGIKRNIMAVLWIAIVVVVNGAIAIVAMPYGIILPAILPVFYLPALAAFTTAYAAFPSIRKYMIDPYKDQAEDEITEEEGQDSAGEAEA